VRFENNFFLAYCENALAYHSPGVVIVNTEDVGLAQGTDVMISKIFSPKKLAKNRRFLLKLLLVFEKY
jgi:hypothetical protein